MNFTSSMTPISIGIDIGGTNTKFGVVDQKGNTLAQNSISTRAFEAIEAYIEGVSNAVKDLLNELKQEVELMGIGIGAPNANYFSGNIEYAPNLRWKGIIPLVELFKTHFDVPVIATNDANAAAIGEMMYGAAKDYQDFVMVTLGTGVGSGFVVHGNLVYGHDGFAGEFGHVCAVRGGRLCTCGKKGCIEAYASARGLVLTVQEQLAATTEESLLSHILPENLSPKDVFEAAEKGDKIAKQAFEYTGQRLGESLSDIVAITSPKAIFLFGGVARAGKWIIEPTQRHMEANLLNVYKNKVQIIPSKLPGSEAAILGASALVWKEFGEHVPHVTE
ncbi:MAG: ROK family protein [Bacteroidota bacterium]